MSNRPLLRIGIYGPDVSAGEKNGCGLWPAGVAAAVTAAEASPEFLPEQAERSWGEILEGISGVVVIGHDYAPGRCILDAEALCTWCHDHNIPYLGIDHGLHILNSSHGGTLHNDLPRDLPDALQHRHPPERGLRHAINVLPNTYLSDLYGEGEVVVNSEHRKAVNRIARGLRASAVALDGVVEALESGNDWWALGVQWNPASPTASGLDIQVFRGLVDACTRRLEEERTPMRALAVPGSAA
jgi:gamma-glutamyl-gamma-aminobutyrate hydrolase PuuD